MRAVKAIPIGGNHAPFAEARTEIGCMKDNPLDAAHKTALDALLLKIRGVEAGDMTGLSAYFVAKKMFACICNGGVGVRLPTTEAANLHFSMNNVVPFQPRGRPSTREWIQINRE